MPQAIFCLLTARQFHELNTQLPRQVWIAMPRGSHTPKIDYAGARVLIAGEIAKARCKTRIDIGLVMRSRLARLMPSILC